MTRDYRAADSSLNSYLPHSIRRLLTAFVSGFPSRIPPWCASHCSSAAARETSAIFGRVTHARHRALDLQGKKTVILSTAAVARSTVAPAKVGLLTRVRSRRRWHGRKTHRLSNQFHFTPFSPNSTDLSSPRCAVFPACLPRQLPVDSRRRGRAEVRKSSCGSECPEHLLSRERWFLLASSNGRGILTHEIARCRHSAGDEARISRLGGVP